MKIKPEHLQQMQDAIRPLDTPKLRAKYLAADFPRANPVQDIDKRYRWDLLHAAVSSKWVCDTLYPYANDTHIDTALRSIVTPLKGA